MLSLGCVKGKLSEKAGRKAVSLTPGVSGKRLSGCRREDVKLAVSIIGSSSNDQALWLVAQL